MDTSYGFDLETEPGTSESYDWALAFRVLGQFLSAEGGVSSTALRRELEKNHKVEDARPLVVGLQFFDPESSRERGIPLPPFKFHYLGRSFYSEDKYQQEVKDKEDATKKEAEQAISEVSISTPEEPAVSRSYRQEEARLVTYVANALEEIYSIDDNPEERTFVFDVHAARKGRIFENADLIAVHWRPCNICELITVEVKLEFNALAVQQALHYTRFSHRSWVAVTVETRSNSELRERNPTLFEYAISHGLGILACRRKPGRSYDVFPIHWPLCKQPDPSERQEFIERYRSQFETAGVIESTDKRRLPTLR